MANIQQQREGRKTMTEWLPLATVIATALLVVLIAEIR